jgi:hypothetical protein
VLSPSEDQFHHIGPAVDLCCPLCRPVCHSWVNGVLINRHAASLCSDAEQIAN